MGIMKKDDLLEAIEDGVRDSFKGLNREDLMAAITEGVGDGVRDAFRSSFTDIRSGDNQLLEIIYQAIVLGVIESMPLEGAITAAIKDGTEQALNG